jgi:predicted transcriptional regulator
MGTLELKNIIKQYINTADDTVLLKVKALFEFHRKEEVDPFDQLPKTIQKLIDNGIEDIEEGRTQSHKEVMSDIKKRYNIVD